VGGVASALTLGFGSGQAVQGRWRDTGWIFTVGEAASIGVLAFAWPSSTRPAGCYSYCQTGSESVAIGAIVALLAIHTWEIGDAIIAPGLRNQRFRRLTNRYGMQPYYTMKPFLAPRGDGALAIQPHRRREPRRPGRIARAPGHGRSSAGSERNAQLRAIRARHGLHVSPIVAPHGDGVIAGVAMRF
ncbi:MAG: hypothetical protein ABI678_23015, partial [Kofleriaceae bacterium]